MNKFLFLAGISSLILLLMAGCRKDDLVPGAAPINVIVKTSYDVDGAAYSFPLNGAKVKMSNQLNGVDVVQLTDNTGLAIFNSISAGTYNIQATVTFSKATYETVTGLSLATDSVTFNASLSNTTLNGTTNNTIELKLQLGKIGDWVLKQIYYAGSNTSTGALFRDQFIEIYNNSNKVLYADSLYIAQLMGSNTVAPDFTTGKFINDGGVFQGQYDWSKSIGMTIGADAVTKNIYAKTIFRVPGNGTTYPVQPGKSFVIAATAINHKAPYTSTTGTTINIGDPSLTVDLSGADFEVYLGGVISNPLNSDLDNPSVPNLEVIARGSGRDLVLDNPGREAIAIFKTTGNLRLLTQTTGAESAYSLYAIPTVTAITSTTDLYYQLPNSIVIDAVQIENPVPASRVPRKLGASLDAGATSAPAGQYSSQSVIRKTSATVGGRIILKETNNSTNDFGYLNRALPGAFLP